VLNERYELGLIGWPVENSLSPLIHKAALRALDLAGDYRLFAVPLLPEGKAAMEGLMKDLRSGRLQGLNVTVPHKRTVLPQLDYLTAHADAIGAVNTIHCKHGRLIGDNTDAKGFLVDLDKHLSLAPASALILGAGGAARAVVYGLCRTGWQVFIAARRIAQATELIADLAPLASKPLQAVSLDPRDLERHASYCSLIVNATSVGMGYQAGASPWPDDLPLPVGVAIYDLVYAPKETVLMRTARRAGGTVCGGLGMLIEQAALAFERWTGREAPRAAMLKAAENQPSIKQPV
jgi:shikimate dehydrogenase